MCQCQWDEAVDGEDYVGRTDANDSSVVSNRKESVQDSEKMGGMIERISARLRGLVVVGLISQLGAVSECELTLADYGSRMVDEWKSFQWISISLQLV